MANDNKGPVSRLIRFFGPAMVVGFVFGMGYVLAANYFEWEAGTLSDLFSGHAPSGSAFAALAIAVVYIGGGVMSGWAAAFPQRGYRSVGLQCAEDLIEQREFYGWQSVSSVTWGAALGIIVLATPLGWFAPLHAFVAFAVLMAVGVYGYARSWRLMDELLHATSTEAITGGYYLVVLIGGGWSVLGHLGLAAGPTFIDWITILWSMILIAGVWASYRRGLLEGVV